MARVEDTILKDLTDYFSKRQEYRLVLLYGSAAKGRLGPRSDLDIAVAGEAPLDGMLLWNLSAELSALTGRDIDLLDLHRAEGLILYRAVMMRDARLRRFIHGS